MMMLPITPQFVHLIQKEKERELERQIEMARAARLLRAYPDGQPQAWYARAAQWVSAKLFTRAARQPETYQEPCPSVPC